MANILCGKYTKESKYPQEVFGKYGEENSLLIKHFFLAELCKAADPDNSGPPESYREQSKNQEKNNKN
jgi:hypothetical protein